jgi:hypothetical protein
MSDDERWTKDRGKAPWWFWAGLFTATAVLILWAGAQR